MPESLYRVRPEVGMLNQTEVEKLMREAGHAINANNGECCLVEDVLCKVTTL